jgi:hypothetical protein
MNADQIKHMVDRFLMWRLPKPWNPDNGISYARPNYAHPPADHDWPTGTNLFDATQAEVMVRHMVEGLRLAESRPSAIREAVEGEREACAKIADKRADSSNKDCERLSFDGSTGTWECSLSHRSDCLCQEHQEEAEAIAAAIRARREEKGNG